MPLVAQDATARRPATGLASDRPLTDLGGIGLLRADRWADREGMAVIDTPAEPGARTPTAESRAPAVVELATAAYLGRHKGLSRQHSASDLNVYMAWCHDQDLDR
jgi:hypothetical protein